MQRIAALTMAGFVAAAAWPSVAPATSEFGRADLTIATATPTGNYFLTGNALCRLIQRQGLYLDSGDVTRVGCGAAATAGSIQNIEMLRGRQADAALVQSDVAHHAFHGTGRFEGRRLEQLRALVSLNQEAFQVLAGRGTNITAWEDLKGRKVNLGPGGTTSHAMFIELLSAHGQSPDWLGQRLELPVTTHTQELCDGNLEALGQTTGVPNSTLAAAAQRCAATLVSLETPQIRAMIAARPYYTSVTIPPRTYPGQQSEVQTFGVLATLLVTSEMSETMAYSIVRALFDDLDELRAMLPVMRDLDPGRMIRDGLTAPLHPGAIRFYREKGWWPLPTAIAPPRPVALPVAAPAQPPEPSRTRRPVR